MPRPGPRRRRRGSSGSAAGRRPRTAPMQRRDRRLRAVGQGDDRRVAQRGRAVAEVGAPGGSRRSPSPAPISGEVICACGQRSAAAASWSTASSIGPPRTSTSTVAAVPIVALCAATSSKSSNVGWVPCTAAAHSSGVICDVAARRAARPAPCSSCSGVTATTAASGPNASAGSRPGGEVGRAPPPRPTTTSAPTSGRGGLGAVVPAAGGQHGDAAGGGQGGDGTAAASSHGPTVTLGSGRTTPAPAAAVRLVLDGAAGGQARADVLGDDREVHRVLGVPVERLDVGEVGDQHGVGVAVRRARRPRRRPGRSSRRRPARSRRSACDGGGPAAARRRPADQVKTTT